MWEERQGEWQSTKAKATVGEERDDGGNKMDEKWPRWQDALKQGPKFGRVQLIMSSGAWLVVFTSVMFKQVMGGPKLFGL